MLSTAANPNKKEQAQAEHVTTGLQTVLWRALSRTDKKNTGYPEFRTAGRRERRRWEGGALFTDYSSLNIHDWRHPAPSGIISR